MTESNHYISTGALLPILECGSGISIDNFEGLNQNALEISHNLTGGLPERVTNEVQASEKDSGEIKEDEYVTARNLAGTVHFDEREITEIQDIQSSVPGDPGAAAENLGEILQEFDKHPDVALPRIQKLPVTESEKRKYLLDKVLHNEQTLNELLSSEIVASPGLITRNGIPVIKRGTINMIQGAQGSHKSRLAALLCSMLIKKPNHNLETLGFEKFSDDEEITVVYIDTERNLKEELVEAVQSILINAGYEKDGKNPLFRFTSIKDVNRWNRMGAIREYLNEIVQSTSNPLVVFVDVVTDCIQNFNDPKESLQLFDYFGNLCEQYNTAFFLVIHENPGSTKPRGHTGTEAVNKASYVCQIGFERNNRGAVTDLLWLNEIKTRHAEKAPPLAISFSPETNSLELADSSLVKSIMDKRKKKCGITEFAEKLGSYLRPSLLQKELIGMLTADFSVAENTVKTRLAEICDSKTVIINEGGEECCLIKTSISGKPTKYELVVQSSPEPG